jgi:thioredoxin 1
MAENITELTSEDFDEKISKGNWVIDFWAEWCGPCKMMAPEFEKAAHEMKGKIKFGKINIEEQSELAQRFEVMSIPSLIMIKNGAEVDRTIGALQKKNIIEALNNAF